MTHESAKATKAAPRLPLLAIMEAVQNNGNTVVDDHNASSLATIPLAGLATICQGEEEIVVGLHASYCFTLNEIYIGDDGKPHISQWATGGTVDARGMIGLEAACKKFNADKEKFGWLASKLDNVTVF